MKGLVQSLSINAGRTIGATLVSLACLASVTGFAGDASHFTWSAAQSKETSIQLLGVTAGLGLQEQFDGENGPDPIEVMRASGGIPDGCDAVEKASSEQKSKTQEIGSGIVTLHRSFGVICDNEPVLAYQWDFAYQSTHLGGSSFDGEDALANQLVMVSGSNSSGLGQATYQVVDFASSRFQTVTTRAGWWVTKDSGRWTRTKAIEEHLYDPHTGQVAWRFRDQSSGKVLEFHLTSFDAIEADVYVTNQRDGGLSPQPINTDGGAWLNGPIVKTYGPNTSSPRAASSSGRFDYAPDEGTDGAFFDQVQAHYAAQKAGDWFTSHLNFQWSGAPLQVFTRFSGDSTKNNARYQPGIGTSSPALLIGDGDGEKYLHLARDTDVIFHEFSHHVIYRTVKLSSAESGIIHEGTADYFAYAINGDPRLAESVQPGKPWLRTAALDKGLRFDDPNNTNEPHHLGQFWSAVLWQLREEIGSEMDKVVYNALAYLPPAAKISDFFIALINADRALNPTSMSIASGSNFCAILHAGLDRGFAQSLKTIDGTACGLDLVQAAEDSVKWRNDQRKSSDSSPSEEKREALMKSCGSLGISAANTSVGWLFLLPLLGLVWRLMYPIRGGKYGN